MGKVVNLYERQVIRGVEVRDAPKPDAISSWATILGTLQGHWLLIVVYVVIGMVIGPGIIVFTYLACFGAGVLLGPAYGFIGTVPMLLVVGLWVMQREKSVSAAAPVRSAELFQFVRKGSWSPPGDRPTAA